MAGVRDDEKKVFVELKAHRLKHLLDLFEILVARLTEAFALVDQDVSTDLFKVGRDIEEGLLQNVFGHHVLGSKAYRIPELQ
jgi:hypothetical protein